MVVPFFSSVIRVDPSRGFIAPRIDPPIRSPGRLFPLRFRRQAIPDPCIVEASTGLFSQATPAARPRMTQARNPVVC